MTTKHRSSFEVRSVSLPYTQVRIDLRYPAQLQTNPEMTKALVTIYSRPGCHLCEEAKAAVVSSGCSDEIILEEINIDHHTALRERYKDDIPVVFINGLKVFKHRVDPRDFKRKLRRLAGARRFHK